MLAELVFLSRFLGLASGESEVIVRASEEIARVEIRRDGENVATLTGPPWRKRIDFGEDLGPYELAAVGFSATGEEIARDTQLVNLPRPRAEASILVESSGEELTARVVVSHIDREKPRSSVLKLDGRIISRRHPPSAVRLGVLDRRRLHVLSAELKFPDGTEVKKEIVFGGIYSEQLPAELTAVGVRLRDPQRAATPCFQVAGKRVAPVAIEQRRAIALFVLNGTLPFAPNSRGPHPLRDLELRVISPALRAGTGAAYFPSAQFRGGSLQGLLNVGWRDRGQKRFAQAIAAGGLYALREERRRLVVYVLGKDAASDASELRPEAVRRYLRQIGVPLRVWSLTGPRPELTTAWGDIQDVGNNTKLHVAVAELRKELSTQRVAWLPGPPLAAYRATTDPDCAWERVTGAD